MKKWKNIGGLHIDGNTMIKPGQVFESSLDLPTLYPNKFIPAPADQEVDVEVPPQPGKTVVIGTEKKLPAEKKTKPIPSSPGGKDVTDQFDKAVEEDFKVYRDGGKYFIYDTEDLGSILNPDSAGVERDEVDDLINVLLKK